MNKQLATRQMQIKLTQDQFNQIDELASHYHLKHGIPNKKSALFKYLVHVAFKDYAQEIKNK